MVNQEYEFLYKILLVGDSSSGKVSFLNHYAENIWDDDFVPTIGVDFRLKTLYMEEGKKSNFKYGTQVAKKDLKILLPVIIEVQTV